MTILAGSDQDIRWGLPVKGKKQKAKIIKKNVVVYEDNPKIVELEEKLAIIMKEKYDLEKINKKNLYDLHEMKVELESLKKSMKKIDDVTEIVKNPAKKANPSVEKSNVPKPDRTRKPGQRKNTASV